MKLSETKSVLAIQAGCKLVSIFVIEYPRSDLSPLSRKSKGT